MQPETRDNKRAYRKYAYIHTAVQLPRHRAVTYVTPEGEVEMRKEQYFLEASGPCVARAVN